MADNLSPTDLEAIEYAVQLQIHSDLGKADKPPKHPAETSPSVRQGTTGAPSRAAQGLFRAGQERPDTRASRGIWDTRTTEPAVGSIRARFRLHFPAAYRSETPEPPPPSSHRRLLAETLGPRKGEEARDLVITNPATFEEAFRHPRMREIAAKSIGVVREHQAGTIEHGHARRLIPPGTKPSTVRRAYKHAALLSLHRAGVGDYQFDMDPAAKREFRPLVPFMRYAHRRVFDRLHTEHPGAYQPFKEEFGRTFREKKHGKYTGVTRKRMRPNERFVKFEFELGDDDLLEKAHFDPSHAASHEVMDWSPDDEHEQARIANKRRTTRVGQVEPFDSPRSDRERSARKHAMERRLMRAEPVPIAGMTERLPGGFYRVLSDDWLAKQDLSFSLDEPSSGLPADYNTNPAYQLRRAMHPRILHRRKHLRLHSQRMMRHLLSGGITRPERWQLGASTRQGAFKLEKKDIGDLIDIGVRFLHPIKHVHQTYFRGGGRFSRYLTRIKTGVGQSRIAQELKARNVAMLQQHPVYRRMYRKGRQLGWKEGMKSYGASIGAIGGAAVGPRTSRHLETAGLAAEWWPEAMVGYHIGSRVLSGHKPELRQVGPMSSEQPDKATSHVGSRAKLPTIKPPAESHHPGTLTEQANHYIKEHLFGKQEDLGKQFGMVGRIGRRIASSSTRTKLATGAALGAGVPLAVKEVHEQTKYHPYIRAGLGALAGGALAAATHGRFARSVGRTRAAGALFQAAAGKGARATGKLGGRKAAIAAGAAAGTAGALMSRGALTQWREVPPDPGWQSTGTPTGVSY